MIGNDPVRFGREPSGKGPVLRWHLARRSTSRRLRLHGLIERIPGTHRYQVTDFGLRVALFFTRAHARLLRPGLGQVLAPGPSQLLGLRWAFDRLEAAMDDHARQARLAA